MKTVTNDDVIKRFAEKKPDILSEPTEEWDYSNTGYLLLASVVERVTKRSFDDYLKEKIFKPFKMNKRGMLFLSLRKLKTANFAKVSSEDPNDEKYSHKFGGGY